VDKLQIVAYVESHKDRFLEELFGLIRIPSVSADKKFTEDVREAANYVVEKLQDAGADFAEIYETKGHPIVYGEKIVDQTKPTVLVYGHYDVQPADPYDLWETPPFDPVIRNEKIYARGSCDDKGQIFMHIKAMEVMQNVGELPCNIKFVIEGEEEVGSDNLEIFIRENRDKLKTNVVIISDTALIDNETPSITVGLRGLSYVEVEVTGPNRDLHSGVYGGAIDNPINVLCEMIAALKDQNNRITIPGFYDKVIEFDKLERENLNRAPFDVDVYKSDLDIEEISGESGFTTLERTGIRPALDVNGIWGGYTGEGAKTVLPSKAHAKISMRLVPNQNNIEITESFISYFKSLAPKTVKVKVTPHHGGQPALTPTDSVAYQAASNAYEDSWGKKPIPTRDGGSIPIVALFKEVLEVDIVLMGFGLDSDAIHSPDEHYGLFNFFKGIETIPLFYKHFAQLQNGQ